MPVLPGPSKGLLVNRHRSRYSRSREFQASMSATIFWLMSGDGQRTKLEHGISSVGRDASNDIVVSSNSISRRHAEIRVDGETLLVRDVGSSNGTFVNGKRIRNQQLEDGDTLAFGDVSFSVSQEEDKEEEEKKEAGKKATDPDFDPDAPVAITPQMVAAALAEADARDKQEKEQEQAREEKKARRDRKKKEQDALSEGAGAEAPKKKKPAEKAPRVDYQGPVGSGAYRYEYKDFLEKIAAGAGHFWKTIWFAPQNKPVEKAREHRDGTWPDDQLHIPRVRRKQEQGITEKRHRFRRKYIPVETSWIEIELVERYGKKKEQPVPGERYRVINHKGVLTEKGKLDEKGFARVDHIKPGKYWVSFPDLCKEAQEVQAETRQVKAQVEEPEAAEAQLQQQQVRKGPALPAAPGLPGKDAPKTSWIEFSLVDQQRKPVPSEKYRVVDPRGKTVSEGKLDGKGFARVDGIEAGKYRVLFPEVCKSRDQKSGARDRQAASPAAQQPDTKPSLPKAAPAAAAAAAAAAAKPAQQTSWIEISLVDENRKPRPGEKYKVLDSKGATVKEGKLDGKGHARVDGIEKGSYRVLFPDVCKQDQQGAAGETAS